MAFITKSGINNNYQRCLDFLDKFDDAQIAAIYSYIAIINSVNNSYDMMKEASRVAVLQYLVQLKENKNGCDEHDVYNRMYNILCVMSGMALLRLKYEMNEKKSNDNKSIELI